MNHQNSTFQQFKTCIISSDTEEEFDRNLTSILYKIFQQSKDRRALAQPDKLRAFMKNVHLTLYLMVNG